MEPLGLGEQDSWKQVWGDFEGIKLKDSHTVLLLLFSFLCQNQSLGCDFENWVLTTLGMRCGVLLSPQETIDIPEFNLSIGHMRSRHRPPSQPSPPGKEVQASGLSLWGEAKFHSNFFSPKPQSYSSHSHLSCCVLVIPRNYHLLIVSLQNSLNILTFVTLPLFKLSSSKTSFACADCVFSRIHKKVTTFIRWHSQLDENDTHICLT